MSSKYNGRDHSKPTYSMEDAKKFVRDLCHEAKTHRAVNHPYLNRLAAGDFPDVEGAIKDLGHQYLAYSTDFIRFLTATISQLPERDHRTELVHNLIEESGQVDPKDAKKLLKHGIKLEWIQGVPHPELFRRFLSSQGMDKDWRDRHHFCDEAVIWRDMFLLACTGGGPAQALGAMGIGTESIVKFVYRPILDAIKKHIDISPKDRVFWDLHALIDDEHGEVLNDIAAEFAQYRQHRGPLRKGMLMALNLRVAFFNAMMVRAEAMPHRIHKHSKKDHFAKKSHSVKKAA